MFHALNLSKLKVVNELLEHIKVDRALHPICMDHEFKDRSAADHFHFI
jgi:hypothetical protein